MNHCCRPIRNTMPTISTPFRSRFESCSLGLRSSIRTGRQFFLMQSHGWWPLAPPSERHSGANSLAPFQKQPVTVYRDYLRRQSKCQATSSEGILLGWRGAVGDRSFSVVSSCLFPLFTSHISFALHLFTSWSTITLPLVRVFHSLALYILCFMT